MERYLRPKKQSIATAKPHLLFSSLSNCMASTVQFLHHHPSIHPLHLLFHTPRQSHLPHKCTSNKPSSSDADFPAPAPETTISADKFSIEKRRKSEIIRDWDARKGLVKPEPPNFEIGWKRSKPIPLEKPTGYVIMDFLEKLAEFMDWEFGSAALQVKVGEIGAARALEEAEVLRDEGKVEDRMVTGLARVLKLMEMDLAMHEAAVKEETLNERLQQAKARCKQAIMAANSLNENTQILWFMDLETLHASNFE